MQSINLKKELIIYLICIIPIFIFGFFYSQYSTQIATHFDIKGNANGFSSPLGALGMCIIVQIVLYFVLIFAPRLDSRKVQYSYFENSYFMIRLLTHAFIAIIFSGFFLEAAGKFSMNPFKSPFMGIVLSLFFMGMGNYLTQVRPNHFVGIRTPWTLDNEVVWQKTHRLAGKLWVSVGLLGVVLAFLLPSPISLPLTMILIGISTVYIVLYSYFEYKKIEKEL